jgi:hypothetical protein
MTTHTGAGLPAESTASKSAAPRAALAVSHSSVAMPRRLQTSSTKICFDSPLRVPTKNLGVSPNSKTQYIMPMPAPMPSSISSLNGSLVCGAVMRY